MLSGYAAAFWNQVWSRRWSESESSDVPPSRPRPGIPGRRSSLINRLFHQPTTSSSPPSPLTRPRSTSTPHPPHSPPRAPTPDPPTFDTLGFTVHPTGIPHSLPDSHLVARHLIRMGFTHQHVLAAMRDAGRKGRSEGWISIHMVLEELVSSGGHAVDGGGGGPSSYVNENREEGVEDALLRDSSRTCSSPEPSQTNDDTENDTTCKICFDHPCDSQLLPCKHPVCFPCGTRTVVAGRPDGKGKMISLCPFCRTRIIRMVKITV